MATRILSNSLEERAFYDFQGRYLFTAAALALIVIIFGLSIFVLYKVFVSVKKRPMVLEFVGQVAVAIDELGPGKGGFVRFHGEHWKARSDNAVAPGQKVKIVAREGLTFIVEPLKENKR